ncbi:MAG TPA: FtsX-like permease family protein [Alphaproteobacteria bacterium]|nr:FtsX-like permease family protein [Alphaproteobacteria bacterium]
MNIVTLSFAYLRDRALTMALNLVMLALGIGTIVVVILFGAQLESRLTRDSRGFDLVIGAKGSPLQLILSTLYHADAPIGNVPLDDANEVAHNGLVATAIPIALGDNYRDFRVVGTEPSYAQHYGAKIAQGRFWQAPLEATLGAEAARITGLRVGDNFSAQHGFVQGGQTRESAPYVVVGILAPTGTVLDRLILTSVESAWQVQAVPVHEITALLITYRTPLAAAMLPRLVNGHTALQAASPAYETARLLSLVGVGIGTLRAFGILLIACAALGAFIALYNATSERRYDIAVMRSLGASRGRVLREVMLEGLLLALGGILLAFALGHGIAALLGEFSSEARALGLSGLVWRADEGWLIVLALSAGAAAAFVPALLAYRVDIAHTLAGD